MPEEQSQQQSSQTQSPTLTTALNGSNGQSSASPANGAVGAIAPAGLPGTLALPPDILKQFPTLSKFKSVPDLAKSYAESEKLLGRSIRIPDEKATPEERAAFNQKLGVPEKPEGYEFKRPDGVPIDENLEASFRKFAHERGISKATAEGLYDWFVEQAQGLIENAGAQSEKWQNELRNEWGYAFDRNVKLASHALGHLIAFAGDTPDENHPLIKLLNETHLDDHPAMVRFFHKLAPKFGEDSLIEADTGPSETDIQSAKDEMSELKADRKGAYWNVNHPGHKEAVARVNRLYEIIGSGGR